MATTPEDLMASYEQATAAHDLSGTVALIAPNATYWFSDGTAHVGLTAIATVLRENFATITDETYRLENVNWLVRAADVAACTYSFIWTGIIDGVACGGSGRGTSVLARNGSVWRVVHEHLSSGSDKSG